MVADLAQTLKVSLGRHQNTGGAGDRLDHAGGDGVATEKLDETLQVLGELGAPFRLSLGETVLWQPRMAHVHDPRHDRTKNLSVLHQAAQ